MHVSLSIPVYATMLLGWLCSELTGKRAGEYEDALFFNKNVNLIGDKVTRH